MDISKEDFEILRRTTMANRVAIGLLLKTISYMSESTRQELERQFDVIANGAMEKDPALSTELFELAARSLQKRPGI